MRRSVLIALAVGLSALAAPGLALAQSWDRPDGRYGGYRYEGGYDHDRGYQSNAVPSRFDWRGQLDRPGDYRCDAFWDAARDDCGARWRDQRRRVSPQARRDYRELAGYGRGDGYGGYRYGYSHDRYGQGHGYARRRGYGSAYGYGHGYGHDQGGSTYEGAYGRPDIVFPAGGHSYGGGRDARRVDWCRASYRSYDPVSGYYRAYSGRLIYCG